jgi:PfaB family protein
MEKIAVVGLSCLFPGAQTPEEFWQNLIDQKNTTSLATDEQMQMGVPPETFFDAEKGKPDRYYCLRGGFIKDFDFDPTGYHVPAKVLEELDSIFQWSLYAAKQALVDSGYLNHPTLAKCGVILGNLSSPTRYSQRLVNPIYRKTIETALQDLLQQEDFKLADALPPNDGLSPLNLLTASHPATLAAQALALGGGGFALDAACASPLYAVQLACEYLVSGKADLMLAGAVSCSDPFVTHMGFSLYRAYPSDGLGRPLDQASGGLNTGEGSGVLALKRYSDAVRDGDRIYATILGVGLSNDGKGKHFLVPSSKGQVLAFERAYEEAGIDPKSIEYVECHATGTDLGDKAELNSMDIFFGQYGGAPLIGSVKSNLGHLLTAAGVPNLVKAILSMANGMIPATVNVEQPLSSTNNVISAEQVVRQLTPWPSQGAVKRAGVSAFGFGGTNAHLVLEQTAEHPQNPEPVPPMPLLPLAIVGMGAHFGGCDNLDALEQTIYDGKQHFVPVPLEHWKGINEQPHILQDYGFSNGEAPIGSYIEGFDLDFLAFKIQPNRPDEPIPQQLLILKAADEALRDAGLPEGGNIAVLIAMETDPSAHQYRARCDTLWQIKASLEKSGFELPPDKLEELEDIVRESICYGAQVNRYISFVGNIMANRISAAWDFTGPSFTVSASENSTFKALEIAQMLLADQQVDAVVVGAVDLAQPESILIRQQTNPVNAGSAAFGFDANAQGWMIGEGAGAIVLKRADLAQEHRVYATIDAISMVYTAPEAAASFPQTPQATAVVQACEQAFQMAQVRPEAIGYLEVFGSGIALEDEAEIRGITQAYQTGDADLSCGLGSIKANIGHTHTASGIASLIKAALCLYHRYVPAVPQWTRPKFPELWQGTPFFVATQSRPWSVNAHADKRIAAVNSIGTVDGSYTHVILSEDPTQTPRPNKYLQQLPCYLLPLAGRDRLELMAQLQVLETTLGDRPDLRKLASQTFATFQQQTEPSYVLSLVGQSAEDLIKDIKRAYKGLEKAFEQGKDWQTPQGSYLAVNPLGKKGGVALVYPGAFTSYQEGGRNLYHMFPEVYDNLTDTAASQSIQQLLYDCDSHLYPKSLEKLTMRQLEALETEMTNDAVCMLTSGTIAAAVGTETLKTYFKLKPQAAFGYSLGEFSMMFAQRVWENIAGPAGNLSDSDLFKSRLAGAKNTIREFWNLPLTDDEAESDFWGTFALLAPVEQVRAAIAQEPRAFLTHVNTPQEVMIAGDKAACQRVIESLKCDHFALALSGVLHCDPVKLEFEQLQEWMNVPIHKMPSVQLYSAADYGKTEVTTGDGIADRIATALCQTCDFPRLIQQVYADGVRIFVELGPASTCSRWVKETLKDQEHVTIACDMRGVDDRVSTVRTLAKLISHQAEVDISPLYAPLVTAPKKSLIRTVKLGGPRFHEGILLAENRQKFAGACVAVPQPLLQSVETPAFVTEVSEVSEVRQPVVNRPLVTVGGGDRPAERPADRPSDRPSVAPIRPAAGHPASPRPSIHSPNPSTFSSTVNMSNPDRLASQPSASVPHSPDLSQLGDQSQSIARSDVLFLQHRQEALKDLGQMIQQQMAIAHQQLDAGSITLPPSPPSYPPSVTPSTPHASRSSFYSPDLIHQPRNKPADILFDEVDLLEMACGKLSNVFGDEFKEVDGFAKCTRIPMPPYLFMSRVTKIEGAERGRFEECTIETEYDSPADAWYSWGGSMPMAVAIEASHSNIFLMSYLGIDLKCKGDRVYRALGGTIACYGELPSVGQTIHCKVKVHSFTQLGDALIFKFKHEVFVGGQKCVQMDCDAGFFSADELQNGQGITLSEMEKRTRAKIQKSSFEPLLHCAKTTFSEAEIKTMTESKLAEVFGPEYDPKGKNPLLGTVSNHMQLFDRVTQIDAKGGAWGLGLLTAEKTLDPEDWYFNCHFKDDYCMPGTIMGEGCAQLLGFYMLYLGLQTRTTNAKLRPIPGLTQVAKYRGQVTPAAEVLSYQIEVSEIGLTPNPYIKADASVIYQGKVIAIIKNMAVELYEDAV